MSLLKRSAADLPEEFFVTDTKIIETTVDKNVFDEICRQCSSITKNAFDFMVE